MILNGFHRAHTNFPDGGTCLEFGVYIGYTYMLQVEEILNNYQTSKLIGFDSWQGLPPETENVWFPQRHAAGEFYAIKNIVFQKLQARGVERDKRFRLVDGFFENSLTKELQESIKDLIFVNVDVDIHKSCVELLEFVKPMLRPGVVFYFDDWKDPQDKFDGKWGEHLAWEEFITKYTDLKWETIEVNEYNQRCIQITEVG